MRRRSIALLTALCSGCALHGHQPENRAAAAPELIISELRRGWSGGRDLQADSTIVIIRMEAQCDSGCRQGQYPPVPHEVMRFVTDSLHARLSMTSGMQCNHPTPTVKRVCTI